MKSDWPFDDSPHTKVFTTRQVLEEGYPILLVTHEADDECWQVLCGTTNDPDDGRVVCLHDMFERDKSIGELCDLPLGWEAWREDVTSAWNRAPSEDV